MVKFTAAGDGVTLVGLGLEAENIRRMQAGSPVRVRFSELGFVGALGSVEVMIFAGENAETMRLDLARFIGPETTVIEGSGSAASPGEKTERKDRDWFERQAAIVPAEVAALPDWARRRGTT